MLSDKQLEALIRNGQHIEVVLWGEFDYRGAVVAYSRDAFQVANGDWYIRGVAEVRVI
ncbi:MAG: hypothetical protein K0R57_2286 [Paenibacillaceae bacterium]|jgi:hypothetical protein|nr:hypothetical protein [Paenibacillaceae bacterium]